MHISVKTLKGKTINLVVEDSSDDFNLKIHGEPTRELVLRLDRVAVMVIYIKTLTGKTFSLKVKRSDTVEDVKAKVEQHEGVPIDQQVLLYQGKRLDLDNTRTLSDCEVMHGSTVLLMLHVCGC